MATDAVGFLSIAERVEQLAGVERVVGSSQFIDWMQNEVSATNRQIIDSETALRGLAAGKVNNLHQVMLALEKANTSFQLITQVRNKFLEGYQELMRMQI